MFCLFPPLIVYLGVQGKTNIILISSSVFHIGHTKSFLSLFLQLIGPS